MNKVLIGSVKVLDFIKLKATNSRLFCNLYTEMGSAHDEPLLLSTKVRWFSRLNVLTRLLKHRSEVQLFPTSDIKQIFVAEFSYLEDSLSTKLTKQEF